MTEVESSPQRENASAGKSPANAGFHRYPCYAPRFWHGMRPATWYRLLKLGRFQIQLDRIGYFIGVSFATPVNTLLSLMQRLVVGRKLAKAELHGPPVFIIGHWRSGTTLLHELMVLDERYSSPTTFQCFAPHHFLITEWFFRRFLSWLLPGKRPMDNMATGWERPQEDEFALMNLGQPSPYRRIAFPSKGQVDMEYLDFVDVDDAAKESWLATLRKFMLAVSTATGRPLVIKSPTHTGRLALLAKAFPEARFIHVTRDPRSLFPSTLRLWQSLQEFQGLNVPADGPREEDKQYVIECLRRMYASFNQAKSNIDPHRLVEVRYEDLTKDPVATLQHVYQTLRLSDFGSVKPVIENWTETEHRGYQTNRHQLSDADESRIREAWSDYFENYGY